MFEELRTCMLFGKWYWWRRQDDGRLSLPCALWLDGPA